MKLINAPVLCGRSMYMLSKLKAFEHLNKAITQFKINRLKQPETSAYNCIIEVIKHLIEIIK